MINDEQNSCHSYKKEIKWLNSQSHKTLHIFVYLAYIEHYAYFIFLKLFYFSVQIKEPQS